MRHQGLIDAPDILLHPPLSDPRIPTWSMQAAANETPACTSSAPTAEVGALPVVAARALTQGDSAMEDLSSKLQVRHCVGFSFSIRGQNNSMSEVALDPQLYSKPYSCDKS